MATTYKDILITPYRGDANNNPYIRFSSGDATTNADMNVWFYATTNGTLSFEGSAGQLFSITNDLTGTIFSVNDISGIPSLEIDANGKISLAHFGGNVGIGTSNPQYKLDVAGDARITGNVILGDSSTDTITLNGSVISLGNNQSIDSGTLFVDATNNRVGIGTTSPTSILHVIGTANITSALTASSIELGNASDTTLARSSAGDITIEGNIIYRAGGTDVPVTDGGTGASDAATARINLGLGTFKANIGNGSANTFNVNHALNSTDVIVSVKEISSGYIVYPDIDVTTPNHCVFEFVNAPSANQYRVAIIGI